MPEVDISDASEQLSELNNVEIPSKSELHFDLLEKQSNKATKLAAEERAEPMDGKNRWYDYEFSEHVFLFEIVVETNGYYSTDKFEFRWEAADGQEGSTELRRRDDNSFRASINDLVKSISFLPPSKWLSSPEIPRVKLYGLPKTEFSDILATININPQFLKNARKRLIMPLQKTQRLRS